jgi:hypothetical protein
MKSHWFTLSLLASGTILLVIGFMGLASCKSGATTRLPARKSMTVQAWRQAR